MPTYMVMVKFTDQGARNLKELPNLVQQNLQHAQALGISRKGIYFTQGEYDMVIIADAPDEETMMTQIFAVNMRGNARTTTMRAFSPEDVERIISKLPS